MFLRSYNRLLECAFDGKYTLFRKTLKMHEIRMRCCLHVGLCQFSRLMKDCAKLFHPETIAVIMMFVV